MKYLLIVGLVMACMGCEKKQPQEVTVTEVKKTPLIMVVTFCRETPDEEVLVEVAALHAKGLTYKGVLNANGINCNRVLFTN